MTPTTERDENNPMMYHIKMAPALRRSSQQWDRMTKWLRTVDFSKVLTFGNQHDDPRRYDATQCRALCVRWSRALTIVIEGNGELTYRDCDGNHPVVGTLSESFAMMDTNVWQMRRLGFAPVCELYRMGPQLVTVTPATVAIPPENK